MSDNKITIRPKLYLTGEKVEENFQNITLRPILKLQHTIIIKIYYAALKKQKITVQNSPRVKILEGIEQMLSKNISLRNQLIGVVIGQFTDHEFDTYNLKSSEYNKRIIGMIKKRLSDSVD